MSSLVNVVMAAPAALLPIRMLAIIALFVVIGAFIWALRHLRKIEKTIVTDDLIPAQRGPRNNMMLMVCAVTFVVVALLLFLIVNS